MDALTQLIHEYKAFLFALCCLWAVVETVHKAISKDKNIMLSLDRKNGFRIEINAKKPTPNEPCPNQPEPESNDRAKG